MARRLRLDPRQRRNLLIQQGIELCEESGWQRVTPQEVAIRAGISAGLLYHYFPSRSGFRGQVLDDLISSLEPAEGGSGSFDETVRRLAAAHVSLARTRPGAYRAIHAAAADSQLAGQVGALRQREAHHLLGRLGRDTPELRVRVHGWLGFCESAVLHWLDHQEVSEPELVDLLAAALEPARTRTDSRRKPRVRLVPVPAHSL